MFQERTLLYISSSTPTSTLLIFPTLAVLLLFQQMVLLCAFLRPWKPSGRFFFSTCFLKVSAFLLLLSWRRRCLPSLGSLLAAIGSVGPYLLFKNDVLSGVLLFLGIWKFCSSRWDPSHVPLDQLGLLPPKEWSSVLFLTNFLNMWVSPTDWASSLLFHSKCPAIWLLLSPVLTFLSQSLLLTS